jgi:hypothetical protein
MQSNSFNVTMQGNVVVAMKTPFHVNPLIWIWCTLEASHILQYSLFALVCFYYILSLLVFVCICVKIKAT